ncbi:MAG: ribosome maturation factor RimP [Pseudomonadota bacterium]
MSAKQQLLSDLIRPLIEALDCELWGIETLSQGRYSLIRVYIEKQDGVGIEDCEKVSRQISSLLDVEDPISGQYTLEVSSPGLDRPLYTLDQYQRHIGESVAIKLSRSVEGRRKISGRLVNVEDDEVVVRVDDEEYLLPVELIDKANIVPQF